MGTRCTARALLTLTLGLVAGCAAGLGEDTGDIEPPILIGLNRSEIAVSEPLQFIGGNFYHGADGHSRIRFEGSYHTLDGEEHLVDLEIRPAWRDGNTVFWPHFGPMRVPFSPSGDELGTFSGTVTAINVGADGGEAESEPAEVTLEVLPSLILNELQPVDADCSAPSKVILDNFSYRIGVEAIGFEPVNYTYVTDSPAAPAPRIMRKQAFGNVDSFGDDGEIYFEPVPEGEPFYIGVLAVAAMGADGEERVLAVNIGVHRPVEYILYDEVKIAEIEAARPVSGCNAGGNNVPRTVSYTESETETRSRTVGVNWNETWLESHSGTVGGSRTTTNSIGVSVSDSENDGYTVTTESGRDIGGGAEAKFEVPFLVEAGVNGSYTDIRRNSRTDYHTSSHSETVAMDHSVTDTESWAFTQTNGYQLALGGSDFWTVSSESSTIQSFEGTILPGEFGVFYRQTTRMALPGALVVYNRCGAPEVVAEGNFFDFQWAVDLATSTECPPLPESSLPDADCFLECGGN